MDFVIYLGTGKAIHTQNEDAYYGVMGVINYFRPNESYWIVPDGPACMKEEDFDD